MKEFLHTRLAPAALLTVLVAAGAVAVSSGQQSGGIVKTQYSRFSIQPGPSPDLVILGSGECIGKIEPCG